MRFKHEIGLGVGRAMSSGVWTADVQLRATWQRSRASCIAKSASCRAIHSVTAGLYLAQSREATCVTRLTRQHYCALDLHSAFGDRRARARHFLRAINSMLFLSLFLVHCFATVALLVFWPAPKVLPMS